MIIFLTKKFDLTPAQIDKINSFHTQLSDQYLENLWLEMPELSVDDFCSEIEFQELLIERASNYDLSTMTRIDGSMSLVEAYATLMNISIEEATVIVKEISPEAKV